MPLKPYKTIAIKQETYDRLMAEKTHPRDSMDMLVIRLLDNKRVEGTK